MNVAFSYHSVHPGSTFSYRPHHLILIVISNFVVNHYFVVHVTDLVANSDRRKRKPEGNGAPVVENSINRLRSHKQCVCLDPSQSIVGTSALCGCAHQKEQSDTQKET